MEGLLYATRGSNPGPAASTPDEQARLEPRAASRPPSYSRVRGPALPHRPHTASVVQEYLAAPMLCDGLKFDLRLYVVVRSLQPLQVYLYREGMARFATSQYEPPDESNLRDVFMHLTNASLNKQHAEYVPNL